MDSVALGASLGCDRPAIPDDPATLTILYAEDERSLQPAMDDVTKFLTFEPLVAYPAGSAWPCDEPVPALAERWEASEDHRAWTFHLRPGARWHDGTPVTADDVAFTIQLWKHPDVLHWAGASIESVDVLDERTVRIVYRSPSREALNGWDVIYPKHIVETLDPRGFWSWDFWSEPVGSGPFRFRRRVANGFTEWESVPDHLSGAPELERVIVKWGGGSPTAELASGAVGAVEGLHPTEAARLASDPSYRVIHNVNPGGVRIFWNHDRAPFHDTGVREALTRAIDRRELHRLLDLPGGLPIGDAIYTPCQFNRGDLPPPIPFDREGAVRLLEAAGVSDRDGDGVRDVDGQPFRFSLLAPADWLQAASAATYVQAALQAVGIEVLVQPLEPPVVSQRLETGDFDAAIWITGPWPALHLDRFGPEAGTGYANPRFHELLERAAVTVKPEELNAIYRELAGIYQTDHPATALYPKVDFHVLRADLTGVDQGDLIMQVARLRRSEEGS